MSGAVAEASILHIPAHSQADRKRLPSDDEAANPFAELLATVDRPHVPEQDRAHSDDLPRAESSPRHGEAPARHESTATRPESKDRAAATENDQSEKPEPMESGSIAAADARQAQPEAAAEETSDAAVAVVASEPEAAMLPPEMPEPAAHTDAASPIVVPPALPAAPVVARDIASSAENQIAQTTVAALQPGAPAPGLAAMQDVAANAAAAVPNAAAAVPSAEALDDPALLFRVEKTTGQGLVDAAPRAVEQALPPKIVAAAAPSEDVAPTPPSQTAKIAFDAATAPESRINRSDVGGDGLAARRAAEPSSNLNPTPLPPALTNAAAPHIAQSAGTPAGPVTAVPIEGLAVEIAARAQTGKNHFQIRLDPPELGRIDVRLDVDREGNVTSRLVVERAETLDLLRRDAPSLERALQQAGLKTSDNGLQFSLRDQSSSHREHADERPSTARLLVSDGKTAVEQRGYRGLTGVAGGIDIRV